MLLCHIKLLALDTKLHALELRHLKRQFLNLGISPINFSRITLNALQQLLNHAACRIVEFGQFCCFNHE